jgi:hypothetical protein
MSHFGAICRVKMAILLSASYLLIGDLKGQENYREFTHGLPWNPEA